MEHVVILTKAQVRAIIHEEISTGQVRQLMSEEDTSADHPPGQVSTEALQSLLADWQSREATANKIARAPDASAADRKWLHYATGLREAQRMLRALMSNSDELPSNLKEAFEIARIDSPRGYSES